MSEQSSTFQELKLPDFLLRAVAEIGFTQPSPIQKQCIPALLVGKDVLGLAQTGSGKTAAFSLPLLAKLDQQIKSPQMLVMAPTRELAIQVADACEQFVKFANGLNIVTLYGGQRYDIQLRALRQGAQIVVGTPGRILDHLRRKTLDLSQLKSIVLDEADEMLRMGFIDDVEMVMNQLPANHQTALFSATMPEKIHQITTRFMHDPEKIKIKVNPDSAPDITQSCWYVRGFRKNEALLRFLEVEEFDGAIIFARTKTATLEITNLLEHNGFRAAALNGDMPQQVREQTLDRLRSAHLDILVATDVAARGLDVERISLVINYDIPLDAESYVHRIGRTGRAGRAGRAILFVEPRERYLLKNIERLMKKQVDEVSIPNHEILQNSRRKKLIQKVNNQLEHQQLEEYRSLLEDLFTADQDQMDIAAALLMLVQGKQKLILPPDPESSRYERNLRYERSGYSREGRERNNSRRGYGNSVPMDLYRIEVGRADGVDVRHIVGAIANEGDIDSRHIGHIKLYDTYSTVELPQGMPKNLLQQFKRTRVLNRPMQMQLIQSLPQESRKSNHNFKSKSKPQFKERKFRSKFV